MVERNQRERLVAALAEVCAERGYADSSVADIVKRAGVSTVTFYKQFADKRDCLLVAHGQLLGRLAEELDRASGDAAGGKSRVTASIRALLSTLAADPPSARLLSVEILAAGLEGAKRHTAAIEEIGVRLLPAAPKPLGPAEWARVAGMLALIGRLVMADEATRLPELEDELVALMRSA